MAATEAIALIDDAPRRRVVRSLRQWIGQGLIVRGEPVPSARVLSTKLQVDRRTISRALDELKREGLLRTASKGGRTLIVSGEMAEVNAGASVLRNAVVVLNGNGDVRIGSHRQTGWAEYIAHGALTEINTAGLHAMSLHPFRSTSDEIGNILAGKPFGVIVPEISEAFRDVQKWLHSFGQSSRVVVYGGWPELQSYDRVVSDHEAGSYELTHWLLAQGRRRIVTLWPAGADGYWFAQRRAGYERAMREAGLAPLPHSDLPAFPTEGYSTADKFADLRRHVAGYLLEVLNASLNADALMLSTDGHYFATAAACRMLGKEPGRDVLITGYDNYAPDAAERAFEPTLPSATVDKQNFEMGQAMVRLLVERSQGELPDEPQVRVVKPRLVASENGSVVA